MQTDLITIGIGQLILLQSSAVLQALRSLVGKKYAQRERIQLRGDAESSTESCHTTAGKRLE